MDKDTYGIPAEKVWRFYAISILIIIVGVLVIGSAVLVLEIIREKETNKIEELLLNNIQASFEGVAEVSYDKEKIAFIIKPIDTTFSEASIFLDFNSKGFEGAWSRLSTSLEELSSSISEVMGPEYWVYYVNPHDKDELLLAARDGNIFFNLSNLY